MTEPSAQRPTDPTDSNTPEPMLAGASAASDPQDRAIIVVLRELGATSPETLARHLGVSPARVRQRLRLLEGAGLVSRHSMRHGVGRPRHLYDVTAAAQPSLPTNYDGLAETLLRSIRSVGGEELIDQVFQARRRILSERIHARFDQRLGPNPPLAAKVAALAELQDENGYLCRAFQVNGNSGPLELRQSNCAIISAASGHPAACRAELELMEEVLDASVERVAHIAAGDRSCSYVIGPRKS